MIIPIMLSSLITVAIVSQHYEDKLKAVKDAALDSVELYDDICAESSSGYENMSPREAHFDGVKCAAETVLFTLE